MPGKVLVQSYGKDLDQISIFMTLTALCLPFIFPLTAETVGQSKVISNPVIATVNSSPNVIVNLGK